MTIENLPDEFDWDDAPPELQCGADDELHGYGPCTALKGHPIWLSHVDSRDNDWYDPSTSPIAERRDVYSTLWMAMNALGVHDLDVIGRAEDAVKHKLSRIPHVRWDTIEYWLPPSGSYVAVGNSRMWRHGSGRVLAYVYKNRVASPGGTSTYFD